MFLSELEKAVILFFDRLKLKTLISAFWIFLKIKNHQLINFNFDENNVKGLNRKTSAVQFIIYLRLINFESCIPADIFENINIFLINSLLVYFCYSWIKRDLSFWELL